MKDGLILAAYIAANVALFYWFWCYRSWLHRVFDWKGQDETPHE
jgi:hypothetical protein